VILLSAMIVVAAAFSVLALPRARAPRRPGRGWARHPGTWLLLVAGLVYLNQVLFTVYV
jgi:Na+/H+ antiporter NhaD/arsenite permease-like protein